jgi:hypothetical protein
MFFVYEKMPKHAFWGDWSSAMAQSRGIPPS